MMGEVGEVMVVLVELAEEVVAGKESGIDVRRR